MAKGKEVWLRVTTRRDGFRRAGRVWIGTTRVAAAEFSEEQLAMVRAEPMLVVEEVEKDVV